MGIATALRDLIAPYYPEIVVGVLTLAASTILRLSRKFLALRRFRAVFGDDVRAPTQFYLCYGQLKLIPVIDVKTKRIIQHPYRKPGEEDSGIRFSIENPVSSSEVRAAKYIAESITACTSVAPGLCADVDVKEKVDLSFVAFGGPSSNCKSLDVLVNDGNLMIDFDNDKFMDLEEADRREPFAREDGYDYGLILKISPTEFEKRTWITCFGIGEWGTSGAAWYLAKKWRDLYNFAGIKSFAVIVRVRPGQDESASPVFKNIGDRPVEEWMPVGKDRPESREAKSTNPA